MNDMGARGSYGVGAVKRVVMCGPGGQEELLVLISEVFSGYMMLIMGLIMEDHMVFLCQFHSLDGELDIILKFV